METPGDFGLKEQIKKKALEEMLENITPEEKAKLRERQKKIGESENQRKNFENAQKKEGGIVGIRNKKRDELEGYLKHIKEENKKYAEQIFKKEPVFSFTTQEGATKIFKIGDEFNLRGEILDKEGKEKGGLIKFIVVGTTLGIDNKKNLKCKNTRINKVVEFTSKQIGDAWDDESLNFLTPDPDFSEQMRKIREIKTEAPKIVPIKKEMVSRKKEEDSKATTKTTKPEKPKDMVKKDSEKTKGVEKEKTEEEIIEEIAKILRNNKIDQVVTHGGKRHTEGTREKIDTFEQDLDSGTALFLLNDFNRKPIKMTYNEGAVSSIVDKGGTLEALKQKEEESRKKREAFGIKEMSKKPEKKKKIRLFIDVGGKWFKTEEDGGWINIYIDHHGPERGKNFTSAAEILYRAMRKTGSLKESPEKARWLNGFINFVNEADNLSYVNKRDKEGNRIFDKKYFLNEWPKTLYAITQANLVSPKTVREWYRKGTIKDLSTPLTEKQLEGEIGKHKIETYNPTTKKYEKKTLAEFCKNGMTENGLATKSIKGLEAADKFENGALGRTIFHDFKELGKNKKGKEIINSIPDSTAFLGTRALGYHTFVSWNEKNKNFFINSFHPNMENVIKKLNEIDPGCVTSVRGVMVFGKIKNLTKDQFLNIINPREKEENTESNEKKSMLY